jgi:hypothetical protein
VAQRRAAELRALASAKGEAHAPRRVGGAADVVVVGEGPRRSGMTEDYLTVRLLDATHARGARFGATLSRGADGALTAAAR